MLADTLPCITLYYDLFSFSRIVFPHRKKNKKVDEIVHKKYILTSETFEFGPLLVGKTRDKYKEGKYPENMEKYVVLNTSPLEADISFCFLQDSKAETYLLDPPTMVLKPSESQVSKAETYLLDPPTMVLKPSESQVSKTETYLLDPPTMVLKPSESQVTYRLKFSQTSQTNIILMNYMSTTIFFNRWVIHVLK